MTLDPCPKPAPADYVPNESGDQIQVDGQSLLGALTARTGDLRSTMIAELASLSPDRQGAPHPTAERWSVPPPDNESAFLTQKIRPTRTSGVGGHRKSAESWNPTGRLNGGKAIINAMAIHCRNRLAEAIEQV